MEFRLLLRVIALPPGINLVFGVLGLALLAKRPRLAVTLLAGNLLLLYCLSTPFGMVALTRPLESAAPALTESEVANSDAQAIVLLSGAIYANAPEYFDHDSVTPGTLARMQYAVWLKRHTRLPLLVSGGSVYGDKAPIAKVMARVLRDEFNLPPSWLETRSRNTQENAQYTADLLAAENIRRILLVTDASHMPRARYYFQRYGFDVIAAPTRFYSLGEHKARPWIWFYPNGHDFERSVAALHEYLGLVVSRLF